MMNDLSSEIDRKKRVIVYIDGFNLYNGLCDQGWRKYLWLDLEKLSASLLLEDQDLIVAKYFTTRIAHPPDKKGRQTRYIDALTTLKRVSITYGNFMEDSKICDRCHAIVYYQTEKQTDVNIASEMLVDAFEDKFDVAILISGDSDLCAPLVHIRRLYSNKKVIVAFPPQRESYELEAIAPNPYRLVKKKFRENQLPLSIILPNGFVLNRPIEWT